MSPKVIKSLLFGITALFHFVSVVTATISYASVNYEGEQGEVGDIRQYIAGATNANPLVVFQFKKFPLMSEFSGSSERLPFLSAFFSNEGTIELKDQDLVHLDNSATEYETFQILELPSSASGHLYDKQLAGKEAILFEFQDDVYDLERLDEFLDSIYLFLEDSSYGVKNVVLNMKEDAITTTSLEVATSARKRKEHASKAPADDTNDKLSDIWTEGLLMCLLVSLFLIVLLVIAISWVGNIDITYGALEKSTNPLKKTK